MTADFLLRSARGAPFDTAERCRIVEILNDPACPEASLAEATVAPGTVTALHALDGIAERYIIVQGEGRAEVAGVVAAVRPGDVVLIPPGAPQRIANTGPGPLVFQCLCTPRFRQEAYTNLETDA